MKNVPGVLLEYDPPELLRLDELITVLTRIADRLDRPRAPRIPDCTCNRDPAFCQRHR
jgi:hypothetical protein